jgi:hypothetical protein
MDSTSVAQTTTVSFSYSDGVRREVNFSAQDGRGLSKLVTYFATSTTTSFKRRRGVDVILTSVRIHVKLDRRHVHRRFESETVASSQLCGGFAFSKEKETAKSATMRD